MRVPNHVTSVAKERYRPPHAWLSEGAFWETEVYRATGQIVDGREVFELAFSTDDVEIEETASD